MEASTSNGPDDVKTFRGRSLEELLPQIRAELGPDAIVLRRREGLAGGVGGFFQRPYVEVDARAPNADERPLEIRTDRATDRGPELARGAGAVRAGDAVRRRARRRRARRALARSDTFSATSSQRDAPAPSRAARSRTFMPRGRRSQPAPSRPLRPAAERRGDRPTPIRASPRRSRSPSPSRSLEPEPEPDEPRRARHPARPGAASPRRPAPERPPSADAAEQRLVAAGLSPRARRRRRRRGRRPRPAVLRRRATSRSSSAPRSRAASRCRRALGPGPRTIAVIGAGGAGKTSAIAHLAAAYAAAGADVAVIALRGDGGARQPPAAARRRRDRRRRRRAGQAAARPRASRW